MKIESTLFLAGLAVASAFTPVFEDNYDFIANDIANAKADKADKCIALCQANPACHAFTFSDLNGGTCWLKSARGAVKFQPGLKSAVIDELAEQPGALLTDVDFVDHDLYNTPAAKADDCLGLCKKLDRCRVYAWSDLNGGTCWLKTDLGMAVSKKGVKAGFAFPYNKPIIFASNTDYEGHDIGAVKAGSADLCVDLCKTKAGCRAFAWNNYQGGMCWLKAAQGKVLAKDGVTAAVIDKPLAKATFKADTDYHDNDFANVPGIPEAEDCVQICADTKDCHAVVWSDYLKGTCWLKHAEGVSEAKAGAKAYVLV